MWAALTFQPPPQKGWNAAHRTSRSLCRVIKIHALFAPRAIFSGRDPHYSLIPPCFRNFEGSKLIIGKILNVIAFTATWRMVDS